MRCVPIDPHDQTWEDDAPSYRVYLWNRSGSACEQWETSEADVTEVVAWADEHVGDGTASIWIVQRRADGVGLIRLLGIDPTAPAGTWPSWANPHPQTPVVILHPLGERSRRRRLSGLDPRREAAQDPAFETRCTGSATCQDVAVEQRQLTGQSRRDQQSVEIAYAIFTGVAVFLGLVIPAVMVVHILGFADTAGCGLIGAVGLLVAAAAGLASTINIVTRARQRGL